MAKRQISKGRLAASSILEVVVAMVIIVMVLGISLMIYSNVMRLSLSAKRLRAQFVLQQAMLREETQNLSERANTGSEWVIEKETKTYESGSQLRLVHLTLFDQNHEKLAELSKVIISHEKE